jgi:biopolymer transport protein ExbD
MPSVKLPKKSTDTDMTPFVDIAFLILTFFIMATKMKEPEKVPTEPPKSVGVVKIPEANSILITMDSARGVFFVVNPPKGKEVDYRKRLIQALNSTRTLNLSDAEINRYANSKESVGLPLSQLKSYLSAADQKAINEQGIPVKDSASNELYWWIDAARRAFEGEKGVRFLIKGDKDAKYPLFANVIDALKRNGELKYFLVTSLEEAPEGTDMHRTNQTRPKAEEKSGGSQ